MDADSKRLAGDVIRARQARNRPAEQEHAP
jgi:hypothetical protein